jgi:hypothetical protein
VPFGSGVSGTGQVDLAGQGYNDPATGMSYSAVVITGYYLQGNTMKTVKKVVALD